MKKKVTNDEKIQVIGEMAEKLRNYLDCEFRIAESQMLIAENDLVAVLTENQYEAYQNYVEKREAFFKIASEIYKRSI